MLGVEARLRTRHALHEANVEANLVPFDNLRRQSSMVK
jgi:hypothetical protein